MRRSYIITNKGTAEDMFGTRVRFDLYKDILDNYRPWKAVVYAEDGQPLESFIATSAVNLVLRIMRDYGETNITESYSVE